jgi:hypothetical protein
MTQTGQRDETRILLGINLPVATSIPNRGLTEKMAPPCAIKAYARELHAWERRQMNKLRRRRDRKGNVHRHSPSQHAHRYFTEWLDSPEIDTHHSLRRCNFSGERSE